MEQAHYSLNHPTIPCVARRFSVCLNNSLGSLIFFFRERWRLITLALIKIIFKPVMIPKSEYYLSFNLLKLSHEFRWKLALDCALWSGDTLERKKNSKSIKHPSALEHARKQLIRKAERRRNFPLREACSTLQLLHKQIEKWFKSQPCTRPNGIPIVSALQHLFVTLLCHLKWCRHRSVIGQSQVARHKMLYQQTKIDWKSNRKTVES